MRPRSIVAVSGLALATLALAGALIAGCSPKKMLAPNATPETTLFISFDASDTANTTNHVVHLYWFGSDVDGTVNAYDYRFVEPGGPANPPWSRTAKLDSVFTVQAPTGSVMPTFEVRSVDNQGAVDPTPASQTFRFTNQAPTVTLLNAPALTESTYASMTLSWSAADIDGDPNQLQFRVWLNGDSANATMTQSRTYTIPTASFVEGGKLRSGYRKVFVQPIDDGGRAGVPATATWYVRSPVPDSTRWFWPPQPGQHPRLLIVDDHPRSVNAADDTRYDTLMTNTANRNLPAGSFTTLKLEIRYPFRSAIDLEQTLALYDGVVWYRGQQHYTQGTTGTTLHDMVSGLTDYLDRGGKLMFESLDLIEGDAASGVFPAPLLSRYLGSSFLYRRANGFPPPDSAVDWSMDRGYPDTDGTTKVSVLRSALFQDSLRCEAAFTGVRAFGVRDTHDVVLWARDSICTPRQDRDFPVAVTAAQPGGGRLFAFAVPLATLRGGGAIPPNPAFPNDLARFMAKLFGAMGLIGP
jgi:hypothetical protein